MTTTPRTASPPPKAGPGFILVAVRAQPRARRIGLIGLADDGAGRTHLRIAVAEPPDDGRASRAVCAALAQALGVPASRVTVQSGGTAREKLLRVVGEADVLGERLAVLMRGLGAS